MLRYILSAIIGVFITLLMCWIIRYTNINKSEYNTKSYYENNLNSVKLDTILEKELYINDIGHDERINSVNKRLDDLYIFGGLIITLLLGINVAVFVNTEKEAKKETRKFLQENFDVYKTEIEKIVKDTKKQSEELISSMSEMATSSDLNAIESEKNKKEDKKGI